MRLPNKEAISPPVSFCDLFVNFLADFVRALRHHDAKFSKIEPQRPKSICGLGAAAITTGGVR